MKKFLGFFVVMTICASIRSAEVESIENSFNCYADYLKRHGMLEESFQSEPFNGESILCEAVLSKTVEGVYAGLLEEFKKNDELKVAAECVVENLKEAKWSDLDIKEQLLVFTSSLSENEKDKQMFELEAQQSKISNAAVVSCMAEKEFGEMFDEIFNKEDDQVDHASDYCARTYIIDNNLIDNSVYHVDPNPKHIDVKNIPCEDIVKKNFEVAEEELKQHLLKDLGENDHKVDCLIKKYHDNHYFNKTLIVALLGELKISDDQKNVEKEKFIESMIKITMSLEECQ